MTLDLKWLTKFSWPESLLTGHPLAIAHRGASDYAPENTLKSFQIAADLCSEMWELDVHLSADGVCIVCHDDNLLRVAGQNLNVSELNWSEISSISLPDGQKISRFEEVIALAKKTGSGLYVEIKGEGAGVAAWEILQAENFMFACIGSFNVGWVRQLGALGCGYPLSILVPINVDPLTYIEDVKVDIIHICWRHATSSPDLLLTEKLLTELSEYQIVLWDEDRAEIIEKLLTKNIMGICSNRPEMLKPYVQDPDHPIHIVCHRGSNNLAPENTLEAAKICIDQKMQYVELDVRTTKDGELVVHHDKTLERTTNGTGALAAHSLAELKQLDAGRWVKAGSKTHQIPTFAEFLALAQGNIGLYVEIKSADPSQVLKMVNQYNMLPHCFFWCHDIDILMELRKQSVDIILMASRSKFTSLEVAVNTYGAKIVEFKTSIDDLSEIKKCSELGVRSMLHSLSSDWNDMLGCFALKPDLANLDYPDRFKIVAHYPMVGNHFSNFV